MRIRKVALSAEQDPWAELGGDTVSLFSPKSSERFDLGFEASAQNVASLNIRSETHLELYQVSVLLVLRDIQLEQSENSR